MIERCYRHPRLSLATILLAILPLVFARAQPQFQMPARITEGDMPAAKWRMSRSTQGQLLWGPGEGLALIYWEGRTNVLGPSSPNRIWFRQWTAPEGWGARERVDQSIAAGQTDIGGRLPAMVMRPTGEIFAAWHDHRHSDAQGSWSNNLEIYGDRRPLGGMFSSTDIRLSASDAEHGGDNGFVPKAALLPDGRIAVVWYDFHWNDAEQSEIALRISDANGDFAAPPAMDSIRMTHPGDREEGDEGAGFTLPSIAADSAGVLHLCWTMGTTAADTNLYYGQVDPDTMAFIEIGRARTGVSGFFDPPKLIADPQTGDVWLLYIDRTTHGNEEIYVERRANGSEGFDPRIRLTDNADRQRYPDARIDADGCIHLVYVDESGAAPNVRYKIYDPSAGSIQVEANLTDALEGDWERPAIAMDGSNHVYVVWEEDVNPLSGHLWFTCSRVTNAAEAGWAVYE